MPAAQQAYYKIDTAGVNINTTLETVITTARAVSSSYSGCTFAIEAAFDLLSAAAATGYVARIRRDSLTGTAVITTPTIACAASTQLPRAYLGTVDSIAGEVAGQLYVVTVQFVAATGNATSSNAFSKVTVAE